MAGPLIFGPAAKIEGDFVAGPTRQTLGSPGLDRPILWHRGSLASAGVIGSLPDSGSTGPEFWDAGRWGTPGFLIRVPRTLIVVYWNQADAASWINSVFATVLKPRGISVVSLGDNTSFTFGVGGYPLLVGVPLGGSSQLTQSGSINDPIQVPSIVDPDLYLGGEIMVATITASRCQFRTGPVPDASTPNNEYMVGAISATEVSGYDKFVDSGDPTHGFTVFTKDAADHLGKLQTAADRFRAFKGVFYQAATEAPGSGSPAFTSSIVPDGNINALLGGDPRLSRVPYAPGSPTAAFNLIHDDALDFFS